MFSFSWCSFYKSQNLTNITTLFHLVIQFSEAQPSVCVCFCVCDFQKSSSSESLSDKASSELKKSFDAVVFDVLKVTPEEYAVSEFSAFLLQSLLF